MAFPTQSAGLVAASSQYLSRADTSSLSFTTDFTLEGWVKFTSLPSSGNTFSLVSKSTGGGTDDRAYQFKFRNNAGTYQLTMFTSSDGVGTTTDFVTVDWTPSTGTWYHVAVTCDLAATSAYKFYVNGVQQSTTQNGVVTSMSDTTAPFLLGVNGNLSDSFFDGRLVLWRAWSSLRTQSEISSNLYNVFGGATSNMAAEWTLDNVLTDDSGNANTFTNNNTVTFSADVPLTPPMPSVADSTAVTDTATIVLGFSPLALSGSDSTVVSDTVSISRAYILTVSDIISMSDTAALAYSWPNQQKHTSPWTSGTMDSSIWADASRGSSTFSNQVKS